MSADPSEGGFPADKGSGQIAYEAARAYAHWLPESARQALSFETHREWDALTETEQALWLRAGAAVVQQVTGALL